MIDLAKIQCKLIYSNIFYGDFHEDNIMVRNTGELVLTDFGFSFFMEEEFPIVYQVIFMRGGNIDLSQQ